MELSLCIPGITLNKIFRFVADFCLVCHMMSVSLDCLSVFSNVYLEIYVFITKICHYPLSLSRITNYLLSGTLVAYRCMNWLCLLLFSMLKEISERYRVLCWLASCTFIYFQSIEMCWSEYYYSSLWENHRTFWFCTNQSIQEIQMIIMYKCTLCIWLWINDANQARKLILDREQRVCSI